MDKALQTQLANIERRTGRRIDDLVALVRSSGLAKFGDAREMLKRDLGMGHGDANVIAHLAFNAADSESTPDAAADALYAGPKSELRSIHDQVMAAVKAFGPFEIAPKKTYLSLRRKKQFAMIGPATNSRVEVGLNMKGVPATDRLVAQPPGGMCQYKVKLTDAKEVDRELIAWIRNAYDQSA
jgi:hypothetical protein